MLAIKAGWSANVRIDDRPGLQRTMPNGQRFRNLRPCYVVSLIFRAASRHWSITPAGTP